MIEKIKKKVDRILNFDSASSTKLSQSTMTHEEHSHLMNEVLEEDIPSLFERIEQLEKVAKIAHELVYNIHVAVSEDKLPNIFYGLRRDFVEDTQALGKEE